MSDRPEITDAMVERVACSVYSCAPADLDSFKPGIRKAYLERAREMIAHVVPPGFKLVPIEPTDEMVDVMRIAAPSISREMLAGGLRDAIAIAPEPGHD